jgi:glutaredoxin 2
LIAKAVHSALPYHNIMRTFANVLACMSCTCLARRIQTESNQKESSSYSDPSEALATTLFAANPAMRPSVGGRGRTTHSWEAASKGSFAQVARSKDMFMDASTTPELYVYDHCPFCVRVRIALGILDKKYKLVFMENDDVETPTAMVGKKIAPIWVDGDGPMGESLDIIDKVDTEKKIAPASGRTDLKAWQKSVQGLMRKLQRPRYVMVPLPEFMKKAGRDAFVNNHQMPPYEKAEWKGNPDFPLELKYEKYKEAHAETSALLPEANAKLLELESLIHSPEACTEGIGVSYDDIDLWARLRSLTIIKGIQIPPKVRAYLDHFEKTGDTPLYDVMAV